MPANMESLVGKEPFLDGFFSKSLLQTRKNLSLGGPRVGNEGMNPHTWVFHGVSKNRGTRKWIKLMIWGYHYFWKHPHGYDGVP